MYDETDYDLDADWAGDNPEWLESMTADTEYERELEEELQTRFGEMFPGKIQTTYPRLFMAEGSRIIREEAKQELEKHELVDKIVPSLQREVLRQVAELGLAKTEWSVRYEVLAPNFSEFDSQQASYLSVTVLVVEGPVDPEHA